MFVSKASGQSKENYFKIDAGYLLGIGNINYNNQVKFVNNSKAFRLRVSYGIFVNPKTSIGLGLGLDGYHNPQHNTLPVFLEARRFISSNKNSLFAFLNLGTALKISQEFEKGFHFSSGLGYIIKREKISFLPAIGINIQNVANGRAILIDPSTSQVEYINSKITLHSLSFNFGIQF